MVNYRQGGQTHFPSKLVLPRPGPMLGCTQKKSFHFNERKLSSYWEDERKHMRSDLEEIVSDSFPEAEVPVCVP